MPPARTTRGVPFPTAPSHGETAAPRRPLECRICTGQALIQDESQRQELDLQCRQLVKTFQKRWGFSLPVLVFEHDPDLEIQEWLVRMRGSEIHQGQLGDSPLETISREIVSRPWKLLTYESFRTLLQELEESEPFLVQEITQRLDLVLIWQVLQSILKNGGSLHRLSAKLERLLVECSTRPRDQILSPRVLAALQQI